MNTHAAADWRAVPCPLPVCCFGLGGGIRARLRREEEEATPLRIRRNSGTFPSMPSLLDDRRDATRRREGGGWRIGDPPWTAQPLLCPCPCPDRRYLCYASSIKACYFSLSLSFSAHGGGGGGGGDTARACRPAIHPAPSPSMVPCQCHCLRRTAIQPPE